MFKSLHKFRFNLEGSRQRRMKELSFQIGNGRFREIAIFQIFTSNQIQHLLQFQVMSIRLAHRMIRTRNSFLAISTRIGQNGAFQLLVFLRIRWIVTDLIESRSMGNSMEIILYFDSVGTQNITETIAQQFIILILFLYHIANVHIIMLKVHFFCKTIISSFFILFLYRILIPVIELLPAFQIGGKGTSISHALL